MGQISPRKDEIWLKKLTFEVTPSWKMTWMTNSSSNEYKTFICTLYDTSFQIIKHVFIQLNLVHLGLQSACWFLWQARPRRWNVYWNSVFKRNCFPAQCVTTLTRGTIPRFSANPWTSIIVYTFKESLMDWRGSG